jgi:3-oxoacyl-[acyl-carrier-protein] synthase I
MTSTPIAITALGMVNALGTTPAAIWKGLLAGDSSGLTLEKGYLSDRPVRVGPVKLGKTAFPRALKQYECRNNALALEAFLPIETQVKKVVKKYGPQRVGVVMGSSTSGLAATEAAFTSYHSSGRMPRDFHYVQHEMGGLSQFLADLAGVKGPAYTLSTACSSSAKVLASARALIAQGWCDAVLVGGADSLCRLTVQGFTSLEALSEQPCNSMSRNRDGFNIGEGAAIFLIERSPAGIQLLGVGESSDAYQMSAPDPEGRGAYTAMESALKDAELTASDVSYINLHGTGTPLNDQMESRAVSRLFKNVPASSTKSMTGHTLGAAGAMEVGFCWWVLAHAKEKKLHLPPHCWDGQQDPTIPELSLVKIGQTLTPRKRAVLLSNSFGFGGSNCSVLIGGEI